MGSTFCVAVRWWREAWWREDDSEGGEVDLLLPAIEILRPHPRPLLGAGDAGRAGWYSRLKSVSVSLSTTPLSQAQKTEVNYSFTTGRKAGADNPTI